VEIADFRRQRIFQLDRIATELAPFDDVGGQRIGKFFGAVVILPAQVIVIVAIRRHPRMDEYAARQLGEFQRPLFLSSHTALSDGSVAAAAPTCRPLRLHLFRQCSASAVGSTAVRHNEEEEKGKYRADDRQSGEILPAARPIH
jgi:hypothetical protein